MNYVKIIGGFFIFFIEITHIYAQKTWQIITRDSIEGSMQVLNSQKFDYFVKYNPTDSSIGALLKIKDPESFEGFFLLTLRNNKITSALPIISKLTIRDKNEYEDNFIRVGSINDVFSEIINKNKFTFALEFSLKSAPEKKYFTYFNIIGIYDKEKLELLRYR